jgi:membrane protein implicated in regulation of membrane protease activity
MAPNSDWLANMFLIVFLFGVVFTVVSLLLGVGHVGGGHVGGHSIHFDLPGHHADFDIHFGAHGAAHADGHGAAHANGGHGDAVDHGPGFLNMPTIMAFITWFGGAGYIFTRALGIGAVFAVPMALLSGLTGGTIMFVLLSRLLWPMMSKPMSRADYHLPGTSARVVSPIRAGGVGEIVYSKGSSRFTAGARSVDEEPVARGEEVVILRYDRGIAYVQRVESILNERGGEAVTSG